MMETRETLEWHFKQLDHSMGLSFKTNFNFAIVGHLLKGSYDDLRRFDKTSRFMNCERCLWLMITSRSKIAIFLHWSGFTLIVLLCRFSSSE